MVRIITTRTDNAITISRIEIKVGKGIRVSRRRVKRRVKRVKTI